MLKELITQLRIFLKCTQKSTQLCKGEKMLNRGNWRWLLDGHMHLFNQDVNWVRRRRFLPSNPVYKLCISSSLPFFPPVLFPFLMNFWRWPVTQHFLENRAQPAAWLLWIGGKAGCASCSTSVLGSTLKLEPKGHQAQNYNSWIWNRKKRRRIHSLKH